MNLIELLSASAAGKYNKSPSSRIEMIENNGASSRSSSRTTCREFRVYSSAREHRAGGPDRWQPHPHPRPHVYAHEALRFPEVWHQGRPAALGEGGHQQLRGRR
eukprot:scaffold1587_cov62-Phaeocystis_antarctica.AAC.3